MHYKYQIGENPDWEMKQHSWKLLRKKKTRQTHLGWILLCMFWIILGIKVFVTSPDIFSCDKDINACVLKRRNIWSTSYKVIKSFKIDEIKEVRSTRIGRANSTVSLYQTTGERVLLYPTYLGFLPYTRSENSMKQQAYQINTFLKSNEKQIEVKEDISKILNGSIWIGIGLFLLIPYIFPKKKKKDSKNFIIRKS